MVSRIQYEQARAETLKALDSAGIALTQAERENVEVADFGLGRLEEIGLQIITYVNTERCCSKELVLLPWQICPEHRHPQFEGMPGKEETFRCRKGTVYLYVEGENISHEKIKAKLPLKLVKKFKVFHEIILTPGKQYTLPENTLHWFAAGEEGCIVSEFSTKSVDRADDFTDADILRTPEIEE